MFSEEHHLLGDFSDTTNHASRHHPQITACMHLAHNPSQATNNKQIRAGVSAEAYLPILCS